LPSSELRYHDDGCTRGLTTSFAASYSITALPTSLLAQYQKYAALQVTNIQFRPETQPLEAAELHKILPLKIGEPLNIATVRASIDRPFATGRYADIQVDAQPYNGGVAITFITKNSWFVGSVRDVGAVNSPPNANQRQNAGNRCRIRVHSWHKVS
jgi:outer membrane protein assembly factor BamA